MSRSDPGGEASRPGVLVSVLTPFFNSAEYLDECIESVLAQTHRNFEYVLLDNCSTDGSGELAQRFADRDDRIRLIRASEFVGQVANYNRAIDAINPHARYFKIVQADDKIDPQCLELMIALAESDERIAMVCSLYMKGDALYGAGIPWQARNLAGRDVCRMQLLERKFFFGAPTVPLFRTSLLQQRRPFYSEGRYHEDTEAGYEILRTARFGFVHAVLAWQRVANEGISKSRARFDPEVLDFLIVVERFGPIYLDSHELAAARKRSRAQYYDQLAKALLRFRKAEYWEYHRVGLASIQQRIEWRRVWSRALVLALKFTLSPGRWISASGN